MYYDANCVLSNLCYQFARCVLYSSKILLYRARSFFFGALLFIGKTFLSKFLIIARMFNWNHVFGYPVITPKIRGNFSKTQDFITVKRYLKKVSPKGETRGVIDYFPKLIQDGYGSGYGTGRESLRTRTAVK